MLNGVYEMAETIIIITVCVFGLITICIMALSAHALGRMAYDAI